MNEQNVKALFSSIDDFMDLQHSPSASLIDGFPFIARWLPKPLQWYRPSADRAFKRTIGSVQSLRLHVLNSDVAFRVYQKFFDELAKRVEAGEDPQCFSRELVALAREYEFDEQQQYFCGEY